MNEQKYSRLEDVFKSAEAKKMDVVDKPVNMMEQTTLMLFCLAGDKRGIEIMIAYGASFSKTDALGRTPLHFLV